ncbi:MAG: ABC transporter ATP-binding protein, partial [Gammaproteobacteria bacterium]
DSGADIAGRGDIVGHGGIAGRGRIAASLAGRITGRIAESIAERVSGRIAGRNLRDEAARLLQMVGLSPDFAACYPHQLSGGQARRVGVARALALTPKLIIADEPTAGLDVSVQGEILNLLNELQTEFGVAMLIITHNLNIVRHIADQTAIMYLGRFVEQGPAEQIFANPLHPYTRALLAANPASDPDSLAAAERIELQGEIPSLLHRPSGCEFHTRCPFAQPKCRSDAPPLREFADGRRVACHYAEE